MSKSDTATAVVETNVGWAEIIGAIDEISGTLGRMRESALSESIGAMEGASERVVPFVQGARRTWKAESVKRQTNDYTADTFLATASLADPKGWARFGKVDGKRTASNLAAVRFVNFALHHSPETEAQFKNVSDDWDFDAYCNWLPTAWQYTPGGTKIKSVRDAEARSAALSAVTSAVSADTRMFSIDVNAIDVVKNAASVSDKLVELKALMHDAKEQYDAAYAKASKADQKVANTAYKARFDAKAKAKIAKGMAAKGYAD